MFTELGGNQHPMWWVLKPRVVLTALSAHLYIMIIIGRIGFMLPRGHEMINRVHYYYPMPKNTEVTHSEDVQPFDTLRII